MEQENKAEAEVDDENDVEDDESGEDDAEDEEEDDEQEEEEEEEEGDQVVSAVPANKPDPVKADPISKVKSPEAPKNTPPSKLDDSAAETPSPAVGSAAAVSSTATSTISTQVDLSAAVTAALSKLAAAEAHLAEVDAAGEGSGLFSVSSKEPGTTDDDSKPQTTTSADLEVAGSDEATATTVPRINPLTKFGDPDALDKGENGATDTAESTLPVTSSDEIAAVASSTAGDASGHIEAGDKSDCGDGDNSPAAAQSGKEGGNGPSAGAGALVVASTVTMTVEDGRVTSEKLVKTFEGANGVRCACVVGDKHVWTGQRDGVVVRDQAKGQEVARVDIGPFTTGVWSMVAVPFVRRGGRVRSEVWVGTAQGEVLRFAASEKEGRKGLPSLSRHTGGVYCLHLSKLASPCPSVFSCSNDWTVVQWATNEAASTRSEGGLFLKQFSGHSNGVRGALALGPKLWTCSDDATLRVWDLATSTCEVVIDHRRSVGLNHKDHGSAGGEDDNKKKNERAAGGSRDATSGAAQCLATDGSFVWTGADDGTVRLWTLNPPHTCLAATTSTSAVALLDAQLAKKSEKALKNQQRKGSSGGGGRASKTSGGGGGGGKKDKDEVEAGLKAAAGEVKEGDEAGEEDANDAAAAVVAAAADAAAAAEEKKEEEEAALVVAKASSGSGGSTSAFRITCLAPMGSVMWAVGQDQSIGVWDRRPTAYSSSAVITATVVPPPRLVRRLKGHTAFINSLCRIKCLETRHVWSCSAGDGTLRVWKQECTGQGGGDHDSAALAAAAASSSSSGDDMSLELAEARAAAATTANHASMLEAKVARFQEIQGKAARAAEAREAALAEQLAMALKQAQDDAAERNSSVGVAAEALKRESELKRKADLAAQQALVRNNALRGAYGRAQEAVAVLKAELEASLKRASLEETLKVEAEKELVLERTKNEELTLENESLKRQLEAATAAAGDAAALAAENQALKIAHQAEMNAAAEKAAGLSAKVEELESLLAAEQAARKAAEEAIETALREKEAAEHDALVARNQRGMWESKHKVLAKARAEEEAAASKRAAETEALELEMRRKARDAEMDSGESSSAATKLREELEASRKQVLELRSTLDQERKDARKTHEQFLAAKRECGDLKRLLNERDALLGASSNSKAAAENAAAGLGKALSDRDSALVKAREAAEREARLALRYAELDIFRLDVIARELKVLDEGLKDLSLGKQPPSVESSAWCRGHLKDVINQCLKETHKLHIGAPLDDPGANGDVIAGCGRKAYLIVDAELYPDAPTLHDGE